MSRSLAVLVRLVLVVGANVAGFILFQHLARVAETRLSSDLAALVGHRRIQVVGDGTSVVVYPWHQPPFLAIVTPACSSISSVCSIACLASLVRGVSSGRRALALGAAIAAVVFGNVTRIAASLIIGLAAGRVSLVLFHDWVGSTFAFGYTLAGFVLLLYLVLPSRVRRQVESVGSI